MLKKEEIALKECFRRLYQASEPKGDYDKLLQGYIDATMYSKDEKTIFQACFYDDYVLDHSKQEEIINECIKEFKIKPSRRIDMFRASVHLGPSPRFTKKE